MKKVLIVSTVSRQFYLFEKGNIEVLKNLGYEVHAAANYSDQNERLDSLNIIRHDINIERSPFSIKNLKALKQLIKLLKRERFDLIHCHSPMGGVLARLASYYVKNKNIIYTAHGFHFYKGAPKMNWMIYYPIEKILSLITKTIITINKEDHSQVKKFYPKFSEYVPGIGINIVENKNLDREAKRKELNIEESTTIILSIGELIKRKNHELVIDSIYNLRNEQIKYLICGQGELEGYLRDKVERLGISDKVIFLGYRNDIEEICNASDIFVFPSIQEGLPVSVMEAMKAGLPVIASNIRGVNDLIDQNKGGHLVNVNDKEEMTNSISQLLNKGDTKKKFGQYNKEKVKRYDIELVKKEMERIYLK